MFAKRKPRQEDEPLVPHGLVWQATDAEPSAKTGPEEIPVKRVDTQPESTSAAPVPEIAAVIPKKPSASSPPQFWHPRQTPELVKPDAAASLPHRRISPTKPVSQNAIQIRDAKLQAASTPGLRGRETFFRQPRVGASGTISASRKTITDVAAGLQRPIREFGLRLTGVMRRIQGRLQVRGGPTILMKARFRKFLDSCSNQLSRTAPRARSVGANFGTLARAYFTRTRDYTKLYSERLNRRLELLNRKFMRVNMVRRETSETQSQNGIVRPCLRFRLAGFPVRMRILFTRTLSEWRLKSETATGDSRLWTSMTMGVCTALLALAIVSSARHYGNASLPSHLVHSNDAQTSLQTSSPSAASPRPSDARIGSQAETLKVRSKVRRPAPVAAQPRSKPRRNSDDDYVARDTYVYYGDSRPKSR